MAAGPSVIAGVDACHIVAAAAAAAAAGRGQADIIWCGRAGDERTVGMRCMSCRQIERMTIYRGRRVERSYQDVLRPEGSSTAFVRYSQHPRKR